MEVIKTTGKTQPYAQAKLMRSLRRAGASAQIAREIVERIPLDRIKTTRDIHAYAFRQLRHKYPPLAARYNLKSALLRLGPTGYPFEKFVGEIFRGLDYRVKTNQVLSGQCITHEVDVVAENEERKVFIECKYHRQKRVRSNVKVALYIKARFDDLRETLKMHTKEKKTQGLIVTNTEFSSDAWKYAQCVGGLGLIEWRRPRGFSLAELIDRTGAHPISALTTLTRTQKDHLMRSGVVLCRDLATHAEKLTAIGVRGTRRERVLREARAICELKNTIA